jgi:hypothetical protein
LAVGRHRFRRVVFHDLQDIGAVVGLLQVAHFHLAEDRVVGLDGLQYGEEMRIVRRGQRELEMKDAAGGLLIVRPAANRRNSVFLQQVCQRTSQAWSRRSAWKGAAPQSLSARAEAARPDTEIVIRPHPRIIFTLRGHRAIILVGGSYRHDYQNAESCPNLRRVQCMARHSR